MTVERRLAIVPSNVVPIQRRRYVDTIRALEELLEQARAGQIKGFLWCAKYTSNDNAPGATGDYVQDFESGMKAAMSLLDALHTLTCT